MLEGKKYLEFGPEANRHSGHKTRFNKSWGTLGLTTKNPDLDIIHDLQNIPYPIRDEQFEIVFASHVIEHVRNPLAVLRECRRVLAPGGTCRMNAPDARSLCRGYLDGKCTVEFMVGQLKNDDPMLHQGGFDSDRLVRLFKEAGFVRVKAVKAGDSRLDLLKDSYFNSRPDRTVYCEGSKK